MRMCVKGYSGVVRSRNHSGIRSQGRTSLQSAWNEILQQCERLDASYHLTDLILGEIVFHIEGDRFGRKSAFSGSSLCNIKLVSHRIPETEELLTAGGHFNTLSAPQTAKSTLKYALYFSSALIFDPPHSFS